MIKIKKIYYYLSNFGLNDHQDILEQRRIKIINELVIWVILLQCLNFPLLIGLELYSEIPNVLLSQVFAAVPWMLNYFNKTKLAKWLTITLSSLFIGILMITLGIDFRIDYAFLFMAVFVVILFSSNQSRIFLGFYILAIYLGSIYYLNNYPPLAESPTPKLGAITIFILMIIFIIILLERFIHTSSIIDKKLTTLNNEIKEKNEMLLLDQYQIENQNKSLTRANKELETFAYIASHDLKSPLRNITSFLNLIQRRLKGYPDEAVHEYLDFATSSAKQMHFLINDILEFSKLGSAEIEMNTLDLNYLIAGVINNIQHSIQDKNAVVEVSHLPIIKANETQMTLLFQNLIENGIKYNNSTQPKVQIKYYQEPNNHIITVKDNGIGISKQDQEKIFEMFQRLKDKPDEQGTGIGLAICKKIISQHGGNIIVKSDLNCGSTFFISIPATFPPR